MDDENKQGNNSPEANNTSDVDTQNQGDQSKDEQVDNLLDDLEDDSADDVVGGNNSQDQSNNQKNDSDQESGNKTGFYKKIGNHEFTSEEEYDKFVQKNYGEVSRLMGENKKLRQQVEGSSDNSQNVQGEGSQDDQGDDKSQSDQSDDEALYWKVKTREFYKENPAAESYKDLMGTILQSGRANINGEPDLDLAFAKALRADGQKVPENLTSKLKAKLGREEGGGEEVKKRAMKSGGGSEGASSDDPLAGISGFADQALLRNK